MDDPRYATMSQRSRRIAEIYAMVERLTPARSVADWIEALQAREIPCMPVKSLEQLFEDPHLAARGMFRTVEHHSEGEITTLAPPIAFSATPSEHLGARRCWARIRSPCCARRAYPRPT